MKGRFKRWRCKRKGHNWVIVDPEWFVAGPNGEEVITTLSRCRTCLEYDKEMEI
jgi:hypothetical protein